VSEGPFHEVQFGVGYDTEEQIRGIAAWRDYNFFGDARQLGFTVRGSFIYRTIAADFIQPHFPGRATVSA
jgi:outer membrane protein assembly factor BamA